MHNITKVLILTLLAALLFLCPTLAQQQVPAYRAPRTADGKPNLNGIWQALNEANWDIQGHSAAPPPVSAMGAIGATPPGLGVVEGGALPYQPWALTKKEENAAHRMTAD